MNLTTLKEHSLGFSWYMLLLEALNNGREYTITSGSFEGKKRKEIEFVTLQVINPGIRPLCPQVPTGVPSPTTDTVIDDYLSYLMTSEKKPNEEYTYGEFLEPQIEEVIKRYKIDRDTNQCCMTIGDKTSILQKDPPCLRVLDTRVQDNMLHFVVYFRSWDLWGGFPTNMGGLQLLKEYMAKEIGVGDGCIIATSKGLHLYDHCWDLAKMVLREKL
jgi:thymidylate synthase